MFINTITEKDSEQTKQIEELQTPGSTGCPNTKKQEFKLYVGNSD